MNLDPERTLRTSARVLGKRKTLRENHRRGDTAEEINIKNI